MTDPRVTVLMSVYNGERFVRAAVESLLAQTFVDFELLVVDDASSDATAAILASYRDPRIRVLRNETNRGLTRSLNIGLRAARGAVIARQDADDLSLPQRLERQVAFLDANPGVAAVGGQIDVIDADGRKRGAGERKPVSARANRFALMFASPFVHSAVAFRRAVVLDELGGYDESFVTSQDVELWSRIAERHQLCNLPEKVVLFRLSSGSISSTRYNAGNVRRVESVLARAVLSSTNDPALAREWPPVWDAVVNSAVIDEVPGCRRASDLARRVAESAWRRDPALRNDSDAGAVYAGVQMRIAAYQMSRGRQPIGATTRAIGASPAVALQQLPSVAAAAVRRVIHRNGRAHG